MTVSSTTTRVTYTGNGVTIAFPTTFPFFAADEIEVIERVIATGAETVKTLTTHYLVNGGAGATGTVTAISAPAASVQWIIRRKSARTQEIDYTPNDPFPAQTHEQGLDRLTMGLQELGEEQDRSLKFPKSDGAAIPAILPSSVARAGKVLAFDATSGAPVVSTRTLAEMEVLSDTSAAESAAAAAASAADALAAQLAAEAAAGSVDLPSIAANKVLRGNAAGDAWELKSDSELAALIAPYLTPFTTGDVKPTFKSTADTGWVMMNDGTIGDASSGATTRANADCEALFTLLWSNVGNAWAAVSGGRGANAAADWAAHKTLALPKALGRALCAAGAGASLTSRALGEALGAESVIADLAAHTHGVGSLAAASGGAHTHTLPVTNSSDGEFLGFTSISYSNSGTTPATHIGPTDAGGDHTHPVSGSTASAGNSAGHANMQPSIFMNMMIKL